MFSEKGSTLLELVVVVGVSAIVIGALVFATIASLRNAQFSKNQAQATKLAQEGIELVRTGRDRDGAISSVPLSGSDCPALDSWRGKLSGSIWGCKIYNTCASGVAGSACYFNVSNAGALTYIVTSVEIPTGAELIPPAFTRAVILSDDAATFASQKNVTVVVKWIDFSGAHQSKLTTILRKI